MIRMAYLAVVGSFSVNGVAALHSESIERPACFGDFFELWPDKFNNKTNGVTQRRWLAACNPDLSSPDHAPLSATTGSPIWNNCSRLRPYADDADGFHQPAGVWSNKPISAAWLNWSTTECAVVRFDPDALCLMCRSNVFMNTNGSLLNILHVIHLYSRIKRGDTENWTPRCVLIGGKAAPGYVMAKLIIKLINNVARVVNTR